MTPTLEVTVDHARRWKPSPSITVAMIALFVALAGTAWAAGLAKNSVKSKQIKDGQVLTQDLGDGAVASSDLADGSVTTPKLAADSVDASKVGANTLGGADIDESSLAGVDASTVGGIAASGFALAGHNHDAAYVNEGQANSVDAAMISNTTRTIQLPLTSFVECEQTGGAAINFTSGADAFPDLVGGLNPGEMLRLRFDDVGGTPDQDVHVCAQVTVPRDYAGGQPDLIVRALKDGNTGIAEILQCEAGLNFSAINGIRQVDIGSATQTLYTCSTGINVAADQLLIIALSIQGSGPINDQVDILGVALEYQATQ
jgi:hypothetical protein